MNKGEMRGVDTPQESPASARRVKMMSHMLLHVLSAAMEIAARGSGVFIEHPQNTEKLKWRFNVGIFQTEDSLFFQVVFLFRGRRDTELSTTHVWYELRSLTSDEITHGSFQSNRFH